jgi:hypothetical protein
MASTRVIALALCAASLVCDVAAAQPIDDAARAAARELAEEGGELYQDAKWAEALVKLDKAYAILKVPTLGHYSARCLEELGRWVAASERYLEVTKLPLPPRNPGPHKKAQEDAAKARAKLLPRIPRLRIVLDGAAAGDVTLRVDGAPVASAMVDVPFPLDPGEHLVVAMRGDDRVEKPGMLEEGRELRLEIHFDPIAEVVPDPTPEPRPRPRPDPKPAAPDDGPGAAAIGGYVALGLGGASLVAGVVTGALLLAERSSLEEQCIDNECVHGAEGDLDTYNALRPVTTITLAVGAAGIAAGLLLVFVIDDGDTAAVVGPGWLGARGRF